VGGGDIGGGDRPVAVLEFDVAGRFRVGHREVSGSLELS
jgi:hypothetical protein